MAKQSPDPRITPEAELRSLTGKFDPAFQRLIRSVRTALRKRLSAANELLYDYDSFFVITYSPTDKPWHAIVSTAARPDGLRLYFMNGPRLPDPKKLLLGAAKQVRYLPIESASRLKHPDVEALIAAAIDKAGAPLAFEGRGSLIVKTSASTRRPRRKRAKAKAKAKARRSRR